MDQCDSHFNGSVIDGRMQNGRENVSFFMLKRRLVAAVWWSSRVLVF